MHTSFGIDSLGKIHLRIQNGKTCNFTLDISFRLAERFKHLARHTYRTLLPQKMNASSFFSNQMIAIYYLMRKIETKPSHGFQYTQYKLLYCLIIYFTGMLYGYFNNLHTKHFIIKLSDFSMAGVSGVKMA